MIKILHIVTKMDRAGQETFIMNILRVSEKSKYKFDFLCYSNEEGDYDREIMNLGSKIYHLDNYRKVNQTSLEKYFRQLEVLKDWFNNSVEHYNIIHVHTFHSLDAIIHLEALRRSNINSKVIIHSHNSFANHPTLHRLIRKFFYFYNFEKAACSKEAAEWMFGGNQDNVRILLNGIDVKKFEYNEEKRIIFRNNLNLNNKTVIGHIGRFNYQKNHKYLIDIFNEYLKINPDAILVLVGRGELENDIRKKVKDLNINKYVIFMGVQDDISEILSGIDILVFPSLFEGMSLTLIEAQVSGLPVVTNKNISQETVISPLLKKVSLENKSQWILAINELVNKRCNRVNSEQIDVNNTAKNVLKFYSDVCV